MKLMDAPQTVDAIVSFMVTAFEMSGLWRGVIGLSGGIDSSVSAALAVRALGAENVYPLIMPYGAGNPQAVTDALSVVDALGVPRSQVETVDIKPVVDALWRSDMTADALRIGNMAVRTRMTLLFDRAKKYGGMVIGTENRSEHLLGYFTRFGDEASDVEPIRNLYKTQVYEIARELGIPQPVIEKAPSAGLWEGQTDEGELGFSYQQADAILYAYYDEGVTPDEVEGLGFDRTVVERVLGRAEGNKFKHMLPYVADAE